MCGHTGPEGAEGGGSQTLRSGKLWADFSFFFFCCLRLVTREASTLIFKIRSRIVRSDLKDKTLSAHFIGYKIRYYSARSDLKNKSVRFSGLATRESAGGIYLVVASATVVLPVWVHDKQLCDNSGPAHTRTRSSRKADTHLELTEKKCQGSRKDSQSRAQTSHEQHQIISEQFKGITRGPKKSSNSKVHPKPSQEFRELIGPFQHKIKGFGKNSHQEVHPKFAKSLGRRILGNTFSGPKLPRKTRLVRQMAP